MSVEEYRALFNPRGSIWRRFLSWQMKMCLRMKRCRTNPHPSLLK
jgi:hypothetical protein